MDVDDMSMGHDHDHAGHEHGKEGGADIKFTPLSRYAKGHVHI